MGRTEFVDGLANAGVTAEILWHGETEADWPDLTCYAVYADTGEPVAHVVVQDHGGDAGLDVFFGNVNPKITDNPSFLRQLVGRAAAPLSAASQRDAPAGPRATPVE